MSVNQLYRKLRVIYKKGRFHGTPVQLVQNVHRITSCTIGQVGKYSTKAKNMVKSTVSASFASLYTKEIEKRWAAP